MPRDRDPPKSRSNVGKPLANRVTRGLLRALMSVSAAPGRKALTSDLRESVGLTRFYTTEQMAEIASLLAKAAEAGKISRVKPETAQLLSKALRAFAVRATHKDLLPLVCGSKNCEVRGTCYACHAKVNVIMRLLDGERGRDLTG